MSRPYTRTDSLVCPTPESELLKHVLDNDSNSITTLVNRHKQDLLKTRYEYPYNKCILYIACYDEATKVSGNTVETLINLGANPNFSEESTDNNKAIHFAAKGLNPDILSTVIKKLDKSERNAVNSGGNTALNLLIKEGNPDNDNFKMCIQQLVNAGIDVNITDNKGVPAIYWAAKKKQLKAIEVLLTQSNINLDTYTNRGKTARSLITDLNIDIPNTYQHENTSNELDILFDCVKTGNEDNFISYQPFSENILDADNGNCTLLQLSCEKCLPKIVECLLNNNASPNKTTKDRDKTPIMIAAENGYYKIFKLLIDNRNTKISNEILSELLSKIDYDTATNIDYAKCLKDLSRSKKDNIGFNAKDKRGNYPLHYAARYGGPDLALDLLNGGASLANKNNYGFLTIEDIDYDTLKAHFDSCIEAHPDNKLDKENMTMSFNYRTLMPTSTRYNVMYKNDEDIEGNCCLLTKDTDDLIAETDVVSFMGKSNELKDLLKHPLMTSFLYLKWQRISWVFYINLLFYVLFCISLICYIGFAYKFSGDQSQGWSVWRVLLLIFFIILACRETFQMLVSPKKYLLNFENLLEMFLIVIVACMLFISESSDNAKKQYCAIGILLAALEFILLIGQHPLLSTNIVMLRTVSLNFFKFLLWYSILIVAFALSFFMLFNNDKDENGKDEETAVFFANPAIAVFKTVIMLTGEFEAGDINFDTYPITSHVIFIAFVFTIAIILLNLLNGLAVSDTQEIKNDAELFGYIARAEYISYAESMLLGNILPTTILNWFNCTANNNRTNTFILTRSVGERVCLFHNFLKDYTLTIFPNQQGKIYLKEDQCTCFPMCSEICRCNHLDMKSVRMARCLIQEKKEEAKREKELQERRQKEDLILFNQKIILERLENNLRVVI